MNHHGISNAIAGLREAFQQQYVAFYGGYRGKMSDVAIYVPRVKPNSRDRRVTLLSGTERSIPYWVLNQPKEQADNWIAHNLGSENLEHVQQLG